MGEGKRKDLQIRTAGPEDAFAVASVLKQSFSEYRSLYTSEAFSATTPDSDQVWKRMGEGPVWVASLEGKIVGTVSAVIKQEGLYLRGMGVHPDARGHGIGWRLLEETERYGVRMKVGRLYLSSTPFLLNAIRLYEKFGFYRIEEGPHDLFETPLFTMEKRIFRK